jgi:hypothetical protein
MNRSSLSGISSPDVFEEALTERISTFRNMKENKPNRAPFPKTVSGPDPDKPVKPSVSVRVETGAQ